MEKMVGNMNDREAEEFAAKILRPGERLDDLQLSGYWIIQDPSRFCFGVDSVLLSDFIKVKPGETVLDLGTGTGVIPILLAGKSRGEKFTGLEIQAESVDMARRSVKVNALEERVSIIQGDVKEAAAIFKPAFFDVITTNPPYMINEHGLKNIGDARTIARHEVLCSLDDILRESAKLLPESKGRFYMVHKPFRLAEIMTKMCEYKIEPKRIRFVHPYVDKEPTMVLIEGMKGGKSRVRVEPPIILHNK